MTASRLGGLGRYPALFGALAMAGMIGLAAPAAAQEEALESPWGEDDEIGRLNLMTDASRLAVLSRISSGKVYDL